MTDSPYLPQTNIFNRPSPSWPSNYKGWREMRGNGGWISVKERLPEGGQKVICFGEAWGANFAVFEYGFDSLPAFVNVRPGCFDNPVVTHWQPLPEPPTESAGRIEYLMQDSVDGLFHLAVSGPPKESE